MGETVTENRREKRYIREERRENKKIKTGGGHLFVHFKNLERGIFKTQTLYLSA